MFKLTKEFRFFLEYKNFYILQRVCRYVSCRNETWMIMGYGYTVMISQAFTYLSTFLSKQHTRHKDFFFLFLDFSLPMAKWDCKILNCVTELTPWGILHCKPLCINFQLLKHDTRYVTLKLNHKFLM